VFGIIKEQILQGSAVLGRKHRLAITVFHRQQPVIAHRAVNADPVGPFVIERNLGESEQFGPRIGIEFIGAVDRAVGHGRIGLEGGRQTFLPAVSAGMCGKYRPQKAPAKGAAVGPAETGGIVGDPAYIEELGLGLIVIRPLDIDRCAMHNAPGQGPFKERIPLRFTMRPKARVVCDHQSGRRFGARPDLTFQGGGIIIGRIRLRGHCCPARPELQEHGCKCSQADEQSVFDES